MTRGQFDKKFKAIKKRLEKDRDDLRSLLDDATDILESNERAVTAMDEAADALSEHL